MVDDDHGNGFPREDTQQRIKLGIETERDAWARDYRRKTITNIAAVATAMLGLGGIGAVVAFGVGRASAKDVEDQGTRIAVVETKQVEVEKRFDGLEIKVDKIGENLYRMALRSGVPREQVSPPPPPTIRASPPHGD
jgi:hypothetical protein